MSERKHIKLECQKVFGDNVAFRIVEQTHRDKAFGNDVGTCNHLFVASNGIVLKSYDFPEYCGVLKKGVFLRGLTKGLDNTLLCAPLADFNLIAAAVREYNKFFSGEETPVVTDTGAFFVE